MHWCQVDFIMKTLYTYIFQTFTQTEKMNRNDILIPHNGFCGVCGMYIPNLFLQEIRCLLNLSSGENLAGWALSVIFPVGVSFCKWHHGQTVQIVR